MPHDTVRLVEDAAVRAYLGGTYSDAVNAAPQWVADAGYWSGSLAGTRWPGRTVATYWRNYLDGWADEPAIRGQHATLRDVYSAAFEAGVTKAGS
jgi:hypothetical protein